MALDTAKAEARLNEALGECRKKNFEKGADLLDALVNEDPENWKARNAYAKVLGVLKETDAAIEQFKKAIEIRPDFSEAIINLAQTYYKSGNYPDARIYYQRMVEYEPKNAEGHFGLANVYRKTEKYKDAIKEYNDALEIKHDDSQAYINLGLCHYADGNYHDAIYNFKMALEMGGDRRKAFLNMALALEKTERWVEACENWERFIDTEPKGTELDLAIEHLQICKTKY
jgi:tetratricopeptide (TPR) repeat protein